MKKMGINDLIAIRSIQQGDEITISYLGMHCQNERTGMKYDQSSRKDGAFVARVQPVMYLTMKW